MIPLTVVACDMEPIALQGFRALLEGDRGFRLVAEETSLPEGVAAARLHRPSIFLVDRAFGTQIVMDRIQALRQESPGTGTVVWGAGLNETESLRLLQAGAAGVVRKTGPLATLLECLRAVTEGVTWIEPAARPEVRAFDSRQPSLTPREVQVRELVERGLKNKDIARHLGIQTGTVKIHLKHIFEKTGIRGRYGLAITGLREKGVLPLSMTSAM
jgi:DNA-binding NarL/FixJ family response regulator